MSVHLLHLGLLNVSGIDGGTDKLYKVGLNYSLLQLFFLIVVSGHFRYFSSSAGFKP